MVMFIILPQKLHEQDISTNTHVQTWVINNGDGNYDNNNNNNNNNKLQQQ